MGESDSTAPEVNREYKSQTIPFTTEDGKTYSLATSERYKVTKHGGVRTRVVVASFEDGKRIRFTDTEYVITRRRRFNPTTFIDNAERDGLQRDLAEKVLQFIKEIPQEKEPESMLPFK